MRPSVKSVQSAAKKLLKHRRPKERQESRNQRQKIGGIAVRIRGKIGGMNTMPTTKEMQGAYLAKDASYDGIFFLGVRTTGIFCRPSCPARKPLPKNVEYFSNVREALFAGYRPCKRCRPLDTNGKPPEWVTAALSLAN